MQSLLVVLDRQEVIRTFVGNSLRYVPLAAHGVYRNDAALQFQDLKQFGDRRYLIGFAVRFHLTQDNPVAAGPGVYQVNRRFPRMFIVETPHGLAVDGHHFSRCKFADGPRPANKAILELPHVDQGKDPVEGVVGAVPGTFSASRV